MLPLQVSSPCTLHLHIDSPMFKTISITNNSPYICYCFGVFPSLLLPTAHPVDMLTSWKVLNGTNGDVAAACNRYMGLNLATATEAGLSLYPDHSTYHISYVQNRIYTSVGCQRICWKNRLKAQAKALKHPVSDIALIEGGPVFYVAWFIVFLLVKVLVLRVEHCFLNFGQ